MATKKADNQPKPPRCENCGGTGLKYDEKNGSALCDCPAGYRRSAAAMWD